MFSKLGGGIVQFYLFLLFFIAWGCGDGCVRTFGFRLMPFFDHSYIFKGETGKMKQTPQDKVYLLKHIHSSDLFLHNLELQCGKMLTEKVKYLYFEVSASFKLSKYKESIFPENTIYKMPIETIYYHCVFRTG